jgi:GRB2-associated-binding protein 1
MFDVRTSKRTYYLVAKSEIEMNKWVECICSVCGLKIHVEEGADDRYSPQPSQEFAFSANNSNSSTNSTSTTSTITIPQNQTSENARLTSFSRVLTTQIEGPSGPYIPISECHTGKPINGSVADLDNVPQLPTKITRTLSDECYDIPRQLNPLTDSNEDNRAPIDLLNKVPKAPTSANNNINNKMLRNSMDSALANPPKVNWSTYPRDSADSFNPNDVTRTSVRSCNASVDTSVTTRHCSVNDSGFDTQRSSSPLSSEFSRDSTISNDSNAVPPPRPPKPPSLRKSKSKSESCASLPNVSAFYDVPVTSVEHNLKPDEEVSPTSKVPFSASVSDNSPKSPDELYDFPRMHSDSIPVNDNDRESLLINATVPIALDRSSLKSSKKHSYTNAPPGYFVNKETVFNYEYRPTLVSSLEDNSISLQNKLNSNELESSQAERSPLTPNSATYNNLPISSSLPNSLSIGPPAVNRDLKPRRKGSDSDASSTALPSPTMKTATIQLQPPPALTRIHSAPTKRSFRKPRFELSLYF